MTKNSACLISVTVPIEAISSEIFIIFKYSTIFSRLRKSEPALFEPSPSFENYRQVPLQIIWYFFLNAIPFCHVHLLIDETHWNEFMSTWKNVGTRIKDQSIHFSRNAFFPTIRNLRFDFSVEELMSTRSILTRAWTLTNGFIINSTYYVYIQHVGATWRRSLSSPKENYHFTPKVFRSYQWIILLSSTHTYTHIHTHARGDGVNC